MLRKLFVSHPQSIGETYLEHFGVALSFGSRMVVAGLACMLHGVLPFLFVTTGSSTVRHLHDKMITGRRRVRAAPEWADMGAHI